MSEQTAMTYAATGVDYAAMDPFKRMAQLAARETAGNIHRLKGGEFREFEASRGESAYLIETRDYFLAHVEEGLGTKNLVADAMYALTGKSYYDHIAQDTVAMIVNDLITVGALPLSVAMHLAVGDSGWFNDEKRSADLISGWKNACNLARCIWGGGETPTLKSVIVPSAVVLSGSAMGIVNPKEQLIIGSKIRHGDAIILIGSSGIHANGLTLAREIAGKLSDGYLTEVTDGRSYGEMLLDPTLIYVSLIQDCLSRGIDLHGVINITGHGWRKLMRANEPFCYVIEYLPKQLPIFDFIQKHGQIEDQEMYGNFNMGAGLALYVSRQDVQTVWDVLEGYKYPNRFTAQLAGHVEYTGRKEVIITPKNLVYAGDTLEVR